MYFSLFSALLLWLMDTARSVTTAPTKIPTIVPTSALPTTIKPTIDPSNRPSIIPTQIPTIVPTRPPTAIPSVVPTRTPTVIPTQVPSTGPSVLPSRTPTCSPTPAPSSYLSSYNRIFLSAGKSSTATVSSGTGGKATAADFLGPNSIYQDSTGLIYVQDRDDYCMRTYNPMTNSIVKSFAGICGTTGDTDSGAATSAFFNLPSGVAGDTLGNVYFGDYNNRKIKKVNSAGILSWIAGNGGTTDTGIGGPATSASFRYPEDVFVDTVGTVYVAHLSSDQIKSVTADGLSVLITGSSLSNAFFGDGGPATSGTINGPSCVRGDTNGNIYICDTGNYRVRKVSNGIITTYAGTGSTVYSGENIPITSASIFGPSAVYIGNTTGDIYLANALYYRYFIVLYASQTMNTFAGTGTSGNTGNNGAATAATFASPQTLALDTNGNTYVVDSTNANVRVIYSIQPTQSPTRVPTMDPSPLPSITPSVVPSVFPTVGPSVVPTVTPSDAPSVVPTLTPSAAPSMVPSIAPTALPTTTPSIAPTVCPTRIPSVVPTVAPTVVPSVSMRPTIELSPTKFPSYKVTNTFAFAGITSNGSVMCWGAAESGGDCLSVSDRLFNVSVVVSSKNAFAALTSRGSVVAWGSASEIGGWEAATSGLTIVSLVGNERAFAGVTESGGVVAFGSSSCGGNVNQYGTVEYLNVDVLSVRASAGAFCALKNDGTVFCWGSLFAGGGVSTLTRTDLTEVVSLSATRSAFAGLKSDGSVVVWGSHKFGGVLPESVSLKLSGSSTEYIVSNSVSFAAHTLSSGFVSWGEFTTENVPSIVDVVSMAHTSGAFLAISSNGSAVSWGSPSVGGGVSFDLESVSVESNQGVFAAVLSSGGVTTWGNSECGGSISVEVGLQLTSVVQLYHTDRAFAALKSDGSVVAWGASGWGGRVSADVSAYLTANVRHVCTNAVSFTAILTNGTAVSWGHSQSGIGVAVGNFTDIRICD